MTRRRILVGLAAMAVVALAAGVAVLAWTWRHPTAFDEAGGWGVDFGPRPVGATLYAGMANPVEGTEGRVLLHGGHADVLEGADVVDAQLLLCTVDPDSGYGGAGFTDGENLDTVCSSLVPIEGERLGPDGTSPTREVVLKLTLVRPGPVRISGITLDYTHGWQRGSQRTGGEVTAVAEGADGP